MIVVTHLPQVAAFADTHLVVDKSDDGKGKERPADERDGRATVDPLVLRDPVRRWPRAKASASNSGRLLG